MFKVCKKCNIKKLKSEFHSKYDKKQPNSVESVCISCTNKTSFRQIKSKEGFKFCYKCNTGKPLLEFSKLSRNKYGHLSECKSCRNSKNRLYVKERCKESSYKIKRNLRIRIRQCIKNNPKTSSMLQLLDCNIDFLKSHLQQTAITNGYKDFNIEDYSGLEYHIDHIVPCSKFNLKCSYHQKLCFNWSNLQILTAKENLVKSEK